MLPANLDYGLALVLLTQNSQNLGFAEAALFYKQLKIGKVKSYYFSLFLTGSLLVEAYSWMGCALAFLAFCKVGFVSGFVCLAMCRK